jgi:outer membrane protein OmpA-like peptidoglycan-associated protein
LNKLGGLACLIVLGCGGSGPAASTPGGGGRGGSGYSVASAAPPAQQQKPDRDNDGILNDKDQCPDEPEDRDGYHDDDGCPDRDNDNDGVPDEKDKCPGEKEIYNGYEDDDGCPDRKRVVVTSTQVEIKEKIYFKTGDATVSAKTRPILDAIARVLANYPKVTLNVRGHADATEADPMGLSKKRAEAVRSYLVTKVKDVSQVSAEGLGTKEPVQTNRTAQGRAYNRRVDFVVTEQP